MWLDHRVILLQRMDVDCADAPPTVWKRMTDKAKDRWGLNPPKLLISIPDGMDPLVETRLKASIEDIVEVAAEIGT